MTNSVEVDEGSRSSDGGALQKLTPKAPAANENSGNDKQGAPPQSGQIGNDAPHTEILKSPQVGEVDRNGYRIDAIFWDTRQFVIYECGGQIRYFLPDDYDVAKVLRSKVADLGGLRSSIEDLRAEPNLSPLERTRAARELAWALALAFEDNASPPSDQPKAILTRVDARLRGQLKSQLRKRYAMANLAAFGAIIVILLASIIVLYSLPLTIGNTLTHYLTYGVFGALGAFLSVITGIRSMEVDLDLSKWEYMFAGATRILIGVIGAFVVGLALDSSLIDPTFGNPSGQVEASQAGASNVSHLDKHLAMYLIFSFIAGFSESLVPSILRRGEQVATNGNGKTAEPDDPIVKEKKT